MCYVNYGLINTEGTVDLTFCEAIVNVPLCGLCLAAGEGFLSRRRRIEEGGRPERPFHQDAGRHGDEGSLFGQPTKPSELAYGPRYRIFFYVRVCMRSA